MKLKNSSLLIIFLLVINNVYSQTQSIQFEKLSYQQLLEKSKKENKLIFIDCYTTWCKYCKWMNKNIFTNDTVAHFYNENFICVKFDMENGEGKKIAAQYNIHAYPTLLYLNEKGETIYKVVSERETQLFIQDGKNALNPEMNLNAIQEKLIKNEIHSVDSIYQYLSILKLAEADYSIYEEYLNNYFKGIPENELIHLHNWNLIRDFRDYVDYNEFNYVWNHQKEFENKFSKGEVEKYIERSCENVLSFHQKKKDTQGYEKAKIRVAKIGYLGEKMILKSEMKIAKKNKEWNKYSESATKYINLYDKDDSKIINSIACDFYKYIDDKKLLEQAEKWSKHSIELKNSYMNNDTYAHLLYKLGKKKEAKSAAKKAIELAKKSGEDYETTQELLQKINKLK